MPLLLAVLGVIVSIKPQPKERHIMLIIFFVFLMLIGVSSGILQQHLNKKETERQQKKLSDELFQSHLDQEFIKGKLSAIGEIMGRMSKSDSDLYIKKMASVIEQMSRLEPKINGIFAHPEIKFVFKNSPLLTPARQKKITTELNSFRNYLMALGFEVPKEAPSMGIQPGKGATSGWGSSGNPVLSGSIYIGEESIDDLKQWEKTYALYFFDRYYAPAGGNMNDVPFAMLLSDYFSDSYLNKHRRDPKAFSGWTDALWDIRNNCGQDFTDRVLYYASMIETQSGEKDFNKYFSDRLFRGVSVVDNYFQDSPKIGKILRKYNLLKD